MIPRESRALGIIRKRSKNMAAGGADEIHVVLPARLMQR
jgi:hypothetical protein